MSTGRFVERQIGYVLLEPAFFSLRWRNRFIAEGVRPAYACAASGHTAPLPPISLMNSRRLMPSLHA
jgi:hypothetical protein